MKNFLLMLSIVLIAAACGPQNTCTCKSCLDPTDTTQCCPTDDNRGGGCFGDPNIPMVPLPTGHNPEDIAPVFEEFAPSNEPYEEEVIPEDELPQE